MPSISSKKMHDYLNHKVFFSFNIIFIYNLTATYKHYPAWTFFTTVVLNITLLIETKLKEAPLTDTLLLLKGQKYRVIADFQVETEGLSWSYMFGQLVETEGLSWSYIFGQLERNSTTLNIVDYSVSQTTLEQVNPGNGNGNENFI